MMTDDSIHILADLEELLIKKRKAFDVVVGLYDAARLSADTFEARLATMLEDIRALQYSIDSIANTRAETAFLEALNRLPDNRV